MNWFAWNGKGQKKATRPNRRPKPQFGNNLRRGAAFELLEERRVLAVTLASIVGGDTGGQFNVPSGKDLYVPLTGTDVGQNVSYAAATSNAGVQVDVLSGNPSLKLTVTGTDANNQAFSGTMTVQLFQNLAPNTVGTIKSLVNSGFYNGLSFYRIVPGFVIQGGANGTKSAATINDEFNPDATFNSPGLLAMANPGTANSNTSEFFITDIGLPLSGDPQYLNFRHTIFGQLTSGFDIYKDIMNAAGITSSNSTPTSPVTITSASIVSDTQNGVLHISEPANFSGSATITVTATGSDSTTAKQSFGINVAAPTTPASSQPLFLNTIASPTTTQNTAVSFQIAASELSTDGLTFSVTDDSGFTTAPSNVTVQVTPGAGSSAKSATVKLTPASGFTGTLNLLAHVDDSTGNFHDAQPFTLTVNAASAAAPVAPSSFTLDAASDDGQFSNDRFTSVDAPAFHIAAATGKTVELQMNGAVVATAAESTTTPGTYTATLPAGKLAIGANTLVATARDTNGTSPTTSTLAVTYAPNFSQVYTVPGAIGSSQTLTFDWTARRAKYDNEIGVYTVSTSGGQVNGIAPGAAGYAQAAIGSSTAKVLFTSGQGAGATQTMTVTGGQMLGFYLIQNNTTAQFLATNPTDTGAQNNPSTGPLAFFSLNSANPDKARHVQTIANALTGQVEINWEDQYGLGDQDFNDVVMTIATSAARAVAPFALQMPGGSGQTGTSTFTLEAGGDASVPGEVGVFLVDDPTGAIGSLHPGDSGYAAAALGSSNRQTIFSSGQAIGATSHLSIPAGKYLGFYALSSGTASSFLSGNSTNASGGSPLAFFSFDAANPDSKSHLSWFAPEGAPQPTDSADRLHLHIVNTLTAGDNPLDDLLIGIDLGK